MTRADKPAHGAPPVARPPSQSPTNIGAGGMLPDILRRYLRENGRRGGQGTNERIARRARSVINHDACRVEVFSDFHRKHRHFSSRRRRQPQGESVGRVHAVVIQQ